MIGGWTISIIALRKRLEDGNSPRGTEKERQIQKQKREAKEEAVWLYQVSPNHIPTGALSTIPTSHVFPHPGAKSLGAPVPNHWLYKGTTVGRPMLLAWEPLEPLVSAIGVGKEIDRHPVPTPPCHSSRAFVFPRPQSPC